MIQNRPWMTFLSHGVLILGALILCLPVYLAFIASTYGPERFITGTIPLLPGPQLIENYWTLLTAGNSNAGTPPLWVTMGNSLIMALTISIGKIVISIMSAYAIVYFRFPFRQAAFWVIFVTLMLPVEVRIMPTYKIAADLDLLNSYAGLTLPLIASATATFLFRQFFLTVPDELLEAARVDGAGPIKFFFDILLPLSRTNIAALFVILFIYGWNQYLWPLLVTTDVKYYTIVTSIKNMIAVTDNVPLWNLVMAAVILAMLPPVLVVVGMQRLFVKGLVETEK